MFRPGPREIESGRVRRVSEAVEIMVRHRRRKSRRVGRRKAEARELDASRPILLPRTHLSLLPIQLDRSDQEVFQTAGNLTVNDANASISTA